MLMWYLITYNLHALKLVTTKLDVLGAEFFAPVHERVTKRLDCLGHRRTQTLLFPGYLFVRLDPEVVHPSLVCDIPGVREFVRFGGEICTVPNSLIQTWRQRLMIKPNKNVTKIDVRNVSPAVLASLELIVNSKCKLTRQALLFELLNSQVQLSGKSSSRDQLIVTVLQNPYVDELLN